MQLNTSIRNQLSEQSERMHRAFTSFYTATKIPIMYSQKRNSAASVLIIHIHVSVSDLYIPRIGPPISCSRIGRPIVGLHKSLTDT
jgi:hypothetical protein